MENTKRPAPLKLQASPPRVGAQIEKLQPYHLTNGYAAHPLWHLHELNRIDKHQSLAVVAAEPRNASGGRGMNIVLLDTGVRLAWQYMVNAPVFMFELDAISAMAPRYLRHRPSAE